ncbi:prepilin-type N-terminal cleavage/methylation domain-containing protein [Acinetobacter thermotolerans]|uniref:prepilin-type N-terminal cleavage/methylation domain-containing protein n=1 Tax=Acinetobacter thermotolerans TaxID=3151487 RepID=UPI00325C033E
MHKVKGFTLIELLVTIAVLAIVAMMAAPSFGNLVAKRKLDIETRELSFVLSEARAKATTLRANITLKFQAGQNSSNVMYWIPETSDIRLDNSADDVDFSDVIFTPIGQPLQRTKMIRNPAHNDSIPDDPDTNPPQIEVKLPLKFTICHTTIKKSKTIELSMNGTVFNIQEGTCT